MTSNNETLYRQMPWAANIAKAKTSNGKRLDITHEMLNENTRDQRSWKVARLMLSLESQRCFQNVLLFFHRPDPFDSLYNISLNDWSLGEQWFCFPRISMFELRFKVFPASATVARAIVIKDIMIWTRIPLLMLHTGDQFHLRLLAHSHSPNRAEEAGDFLKVLR